MAPALALRLPNLEELDPPPDYIAMVKAGEKLRALRIQLDAAAAARIKQNDAIIEYLDSLAAPLTEEKADLLLEQLRKVEQRVAGTLAVYRKAHTFFSQLFVRISRGRGAQKPGLEELRQSVRGGVEHVTRDVERQRELLRSYRDLRWAVVALQAQHAGRGPGPLISTPEEYREQRRREG